MALSGNPYTVHKPPTPSPPNGHVVTHNRYQHIDALRAVAVLLVVFSHAGFERVIPGSTGVTIFFVISGFIITSLLLRERARSNSFDVKGFYFRRLFKLAPPFIVAILLPTLIYSFFARVSWTEVLAQIFFVFNWLYMSGAGRDVLPGSGVVWSLAIEEQFYIVFALIWLLSVKSAHYRTILLFLGGAAVAYSTVARFVLFAGGATDIRILYGTDTRLDSIALGTLGAILYAQLDDTGRLGRLLRSNWIVVSALALFALSVLLRTDAYKETLRFSAESLGTILLILYGLVRHDGWIARPLHAAAQWRVVQIIGLSSYSIYLVHLILIKALASLLEPLPLVARVLILATVGIAAGVALWRCLERPMLILRDRVAAPSGLRGQPSPVSKEAK